MKLNDYRDQQIWLVYVEDNRKEQVVLRGVDIGGIWIESQAATEVALELANLSASKTTLLLFVPYGQLKMIAVLADFPSLSETSFGLNRP